MTTYRQRAWDIAIDQYGYITTGEATEAGIPPGELAKLAGRGRLRNVARGIYHFDDMPTNKLDQFYEAVLRVGKDAFLTGDAVLALHDLALVNPRRIKVGTRRRHRRELPPWINMVKATAEPSDIVMFEGIPTLKVAQAIREARNYVMHQRLIDALPAAQLEGLIAPDEVESLTKELLEAKP
jgi:predicted transcriptional regulator of viral defense system